MTSLMPDVANQSAAQTASTLDRVGMSNIEIPLMIATDDSQQRPVSARVSAFVNLIKPEAKGIHMSRLYLLLDQLSNESELNLHTLASLLNDFVTSHDDLSDSAQLTFAFDYHMRRKSLISGKQGWKAYPLVLNGTLQQGKLTVELSIDVPYSSTCPCSAALARQLIQQSFEQQFANQPIEFDAIHAWLGTTQGIVATPHSQRSIAQIKIRLAEQVSTLPVKAIVDAVEAALQTPVQAAVKREDEQEFARLNGQNLMFCEDAARKLKLVLDTAPQVADFWVRVNHLESLHAHDAVAIATKGLSAGYRA